MHMKSQYFIIAILALIVCSCKQVKNEWVNFDSYDGLDPATAFIPYKMIIEGGETEEYISQRLNALEAQSAEGDDNADVDTIDGRTPMRTTSFNAVGLAKAIISQWHSENAVSYCGTYMSIDENGDLIRLSGRVILPKNSRPKRIVLVSHYTIGANAEAPSMSFPLEGILAARGLAVIIPDYIGYGVTADRVHPYLCADLTAENVIDMYQACLPFLEHINMLPEHDDIILFGYSQGGATTMAVERQIEYYYDDIKIRLVLAGGGPYDICTTYDKLIEKNHTDYPCAIPLIIQGMNIGHHLNLDYSKFFLPNTLAHYDEWINSKRYAMAEITELMGTKQLSDIMTLEACNKTSDGMTDLYLAMLSNSLATGWYPRAPVYLFHSIDDNVVPFENAEMLQQSIQGECNVDYNFGHYGNHVAGYLRFLYTAVNFLYEHGEISKKIM